MKKIVFLTPCLMTDKNRQTNKEALDALLEMFPDVPHVIYAQEFKPEDYSKDTRVTYIGKTSRKGWMEPRNELLKWLYASDYDYAIWIDATDRYFQDPKDELHNVLKWILLPSTPILTRIYPATVAADIRERIDGDGVVEWKHTSLIDTIKYLHPGSGYIFANYKKHFGKELYIDIPGMLKIEPNGYFEDQFLYAIQQEAFGNPWVAPNVLLDDNYGDTSTWNIGVEGSQEGDIRATPEQQAAFVELARTEAFYCLLTPYQQKN